MKIIGINGSPRAKGNTRLALDTMGEVFAQEGVEFDILHIGPQALPLLRLLPLRQNPHLHPPGRRPERHV